MSRYDVADEYMEVVYKLWEGSWEDDAVRARPRRDGIYADPGKVHGCSTTAALPGRRHSPGRAVAAAHAGAVSGRLVDARPGVCRETCRMRLRSADRTSDITRDIVADIRAASGGARPRSAGYPGLRRHAPSSSAAPGEEAEDKYEEYRRHASIEGALAHFSSSAGVDFSHYDPDEPIRYEKNNANNSALEAITKRSAGTMDSAQDLSSRMVLGSRQAPIVGSAGGDRRRLHRLGRGSRHRRLQSQPRRDARRASRISSIWSCRSCRSAACTSATTPIRHLAREAVRPAARGLPEKPSRRLVSVARPSAFERLAGYRAGRRVTEREGVQIPRMS